MDPRDRSGLVWMQAITKVHGDYKAGAISGMASTLAMRRGETSYTCDDIRQAIGEIFGRRATGCSHDPR